MKTPKPTVSLARLLIAAIELRIRSTVQTEIEQTISDLEAFAQTLVNTAVERFGGLDIAFNNAGTVGEMGPAQDTPLGTWQSVLDTNLTSAFLGAKYQIPAMLARGGGY